MSEFHKLLGRLNEKDILLSTPKMDNSNYTEALDFLTGRELSKLKKNALEEHQSLERQLEEARENIYKYAEIAMMEGKDNFGYSWEDFKLYVLDEELKEKGDERG